MALLPDRIIGEALELRRWDPRDVDDAMSAVALSLEQLQLWMPWAQSQQTREEVLDVFRAAVVSFDADQNYDYLLYERATGDYVGSAGLHCADSPDFPEIGYWVRSDRTGRGYATEAARLLSEAAFRHLTKIEHVKIRMDQANAASAAVPPKLGFHFLASEARPIEAKGHTGVGLVWEMTRPH